MATKGLKRVQILACSIVAPVLVVTSLLVFRTFHYRHLANKLLVEVESLSMGASGHKVGTLHASFRNYVVWGPSESSKCDDSCTVRISIGDDWIGRFIWRHRILGELGIRPAWVRADIVVEASEVRSISYRIVSVPSIANLELESNESQGEAYSIGLRRIAVQADWQGFFGDEIYAHLSKEVSRDQRKRAFDIDLKCFSNFGTSCDPCSMMRSVCEDLKTRQRVAP